MKKILLIILLTLSTITNYTLTKQGILCGLKRDMLKQSEFTYTNLNDYINLTHPELSDYIIRQFILETGWFRSKSFTNSNNIAGMRKISTKWYSPATGIKYGYCEYRHWTCSVDDYMNRLIYYQSLGYDINDFYAYVVNSNYAESVEYVELLKGIDLRRFKNKLI